MTQAILHYAQKSITSGCGDVYSQHGDLEDLLLSSKQYYITLEKNATKSHGETTRSVTKLTAVISSKVARRMSRQTQAILHYVLASISLTTKMPTTARQLHKINNRVARRMSNQTQAILHYVLVSISLTTLMPITVR